MAMVASQSTYATFKSAFVTLGGSKTTSILAADSTPSGGSFNCIAFFPRDNTFVQVNLPV